MPYFAEIVHLHDTPDGFPIERLDQPHPTIEEAVAAARRHIDAMSAESGTVKYLIVDEDGVFIELTDAQRGES